MNEILIRTYLCVLRYEAKVESHRINDGLYSIHQECVEDSQVNDVFSNTDFLGDAGELNAYLDECIRRSKYEYQ